MTPVHQINLKSHPKLMKFFLMLLKEILMTNLVIKE